MKLNLAFRGYTGAVLIFQDIVQIDESDLDAQIDAAAEKHLKMLATHPKHTIEIEFLDEPDNPHRFLRIGTETSRMVRPFAITDDESIKQAAVFFTRKGRPA